MVDTDRCPSAEERASPGSNRYRKSKNRRKKAGKQKQGDVKHGDYFNSISYETIVSGLFVTYWPCLQKCVMTLEMPAADTGWGNVNDR